MTDILTWTDAHKAGFGRENLTFTHDLHNSPLFTDEALIALIDRYPRDKLEVFTMGYDPTAIRVTSWKCSPWVTTRPTGGSGSSAGAARMTDAR